MLCFSAYPRRCSCEVLELAPAAMIDDFSCLYIYALLAVVPTQQERDLRCSRQAFTGKMVAVRRKVGS